MTTPANTSKSTNPLSAARSTLVSPTETILALSSKLSLCMLMIGTSLLFFNSSNQNHSLPFFYRRLFAIVLIVLPCVIAVTSTFDFVVVIDKYSVHCMKDNSCLYSKNTIVLAKCVYIILTAGISMAGLLFAFLMIKYDHVILRFL